MKVKQAHYLFSGFRPTASLRVAALIAAAFGLLSTMAGAQTTVFHYRVNNTDVAGLPAIPSVGGSPGTALDPTSGIFSTDIPTVGVPAGAGNRSLVGAGDAASGGVNSAGASELTNSSIIAAGGYTMETWFLWNGGGVINSIIDYAGTEKFRLVDGVLDYNFDNATGPVAITSPTSGEWHYVAMVFSHDGDDEVEGKIGGTATFYFDSNSPLSSATVVKDDFGDGLERPIGVGHHPLSFTDDDFDGLVYEPRVTLGVLEDAQLLIKPALSFSKSFAPDTIGPGSVTTLTFTITNNTATGIRDVEFDDNFPAGLVIANPPNLFSDCGGTVIADPGKASVQLSEGSVPGNGACTISVDVTAETTGGYLNTTGELRSDAGTFPGASAELKVDEQLPGFSKSFSPKKIGLGGRSTLTFTINNSDNEGTRTNLLFTDVLPVGMVVANPANAVSTCGGVVTAVPGSDTISLGGQIPDVGMVGAFEICTVSVDVIGNGVGTHENVSGELTSTLVNEFTAISSGFASAILEVVNDQIILSKSFKNDPVPPGGTVELEFRITNRSRDDVARGIRFTDNLEAMLPGLTAISPTQNDICGDGSVLEGTSELKFGGGVLAPGASCTFTVQLQLPPDAPSGTFLNTSSPVVGSIGGRQVQGSPAVDSLAVSPVPIFTKEFIDDPVTPGGTVTLEFNITNTSRRSEAIDIAFTDELPAELIAAELLPENGFCGELSTLEFLPPTPGTGGGGTLARITVSGASLKPQASCKFSVVLIVSEGASTGIVTNTTGPLTAVIDDAIVTGPPASDELRIFSGPQLTKSFIDSPVRPGGFATLRFTLVHSAEAPEAAKNIRFVDNLDNVIPGMVAIGLPRENICGDGSLLRGTSQIAFNEGSLGIGETCSFDVRVLVPADAPFGLVTNVTSQVLSDIGGQTLSSSPATADLLVSNLSFTKRFLDSPAIPGDTSKLEFTITNHGSVEARSMVFTDNLDEALAGLVSVSELQNDICGDGSSIGGTGQVAFQGGILAADSSCTFSIDVRVPVDTVEGDYINVTSTLGATIAEKPVSIPAASAVLSVTSALLAIDKAFVRSPVIAGESNGLRFTITNLDPNRTASDISFTDELQSGLVGTGDQQKEICGADSQISGSSTLTMTGGELAGGASCSFVVPVLVPSNPPAGEEGDFTIENITSEVTGTINGFTVRGDPAATELLVTLQSPPDPENFKISFFELDDNGSVKIRWPSANRLRYCVQRSTNLKVWNTVEEFVGEGNPLEFIDENPPGGRIYYRVVEKIGS